MQGVKYFHKFHPVFLSFISDFWHYLLGISFPFYFSLIEWYLKLVFPLIAGGGSPPKPWERAGSSSGPAPFKPSSAGNTSDVVEASGTANPGEIVTTADRNTAVNRNTLARPVPSRPWEQQQTYGSTYGGISLLIFYPFLSFAWNSIIWRSFYYKVTFYPSNMVFDREN